MANASLQGSLDSFKLPEILTFPTNNLVNGDNVMAVEVHQVSCCGAGTSSDDVFGTQLSAIQSTTNIITTTTVSNGASDAEASRTLPDAGRVPSCTIPFPLALTLWPVPTTPSENAIVLDVPSVVSRIP